MSAASAERPSQPDPSELWRSYPLKQKPATVAKSPATATASKHRNTQAPASSAADKGGGGPSSALIAAIGFAAALLVVAAMALLRRRRQPAAAGPVFPPAAPRAAPLAAAPAAAQRPLEPVPPPPMPAARPRTARGATTVRKSITCQIRWNRRGRSFYAVSVDANGIEHMLASSAHLEEAGPAPPDETPEIRAALRHLAKELRDRGWRPLRAKGIDFEERRWYARRFRWPTEEELAEAGHADAGEVDEQVSGRSGGGR